MKVKVAIAGRFVPLSRFSTLLFFWKLEVMDACTNDKLPALVASVVLIQLLHMPGSGQQQDDN